MSEFVGKLKEFENWLDSQNVWNINQTEKDGLLEIYTSFIKAQEIKELGYKILSIVLPGKNYRKEYNEKTGKFHSDNDEDLNGMYLTSAINNGWIIESVEKDKTILRLNDIVEIESELNSRGILTSFSFDENGLWVSIKFTSDPNDEGGAYIEYVFKSLPLFNTFDCKPVYYGDSYLYVKQEIENGEFKGPFKCTFAEKVMEKYSFSNEDNCNQFLAVSKYLGENFDPDDYRLKMYQ